MSVGGGVFVDPSKLPDKQLSLVRPCDMLAAQLDAFLAELTGQ